MIALFLFFMALFSGQVVSYNYNTAVWCNYDSDFSVCNNIQGDLTKVVNDQLNAIYTKYTSGVNAPNRWTRHDENRRNLRVENDVDQEQRKLQGPCPYSKCVRAYGGGAKAAETCSFFCPNGRRRDLDAPEESGDKETNADNRDLAATAKQNAANTNDYSASLQQDLRNAAQKAYWYEANNSLKASDECKKLLEKAQCDASVTAIIP